MRNKSVAELQVEIEVDYIIRMREYNHHLETLEHEKRNFIEANPDFPKELVAVMFINVMAPPQTIILKEIK